MGRAKQQKERSLFFDLTMKTQIVRSMYLLMNTCPADQAYIFDI